jgi:hypothetical protein
VKKKNFGASCSNSADEFYFVVLFSFFGGDDEIDRWQFFTGLQNSGILVIYQLNH